MKTVKVKTEKEVKIEGEKKMKDRRMKKIISIFRKVFSEQIKHREVRLTSIHEEALKLVAKHDLPIPRYSVDIKGPLRGGGMLPLWYKEVKVTLSYIYHGVTIKKEVIATFGLGTHVDDYD